MKVKYISQIFALAIVVTFSGCMLKMLDRDNSGGGMGMGMGMMSGMSMMGGAKSQKNPQNDMDMGGTEMETNQKSNSYVIAKHYCTQCHEMKKREILSKNEWKPTLKRMISRMETQGKKRPDAYERVMIEHYYGVQ